MAAADYSFHDILEFSPLFRLFNYLIGARHARSVLAHEYIRARKGLSILDIGCGTGDMLSFFPEVRYTGFDASASYIAAAKRRLGSRGTFLRMPLAEVAPGQFHGFDLVLAIGILHHLPDPEALRLLHLARAALTPQGRLVTYDGCRTEGQSRITRAVLASDRGAFVRWDKDLYSLASQVFPKTVPTVRHDLLRIPYTHLIMQCTNGN
jgi:cyclopropane fatty-acyl-phospholipid synthase-like methyltransferase